MVEVLVTLVVLIVAVLIFKARGKNPGGGVFHKDDPSKNDPE